MCTLSWQSGPAGFDLFFNRDEKRSRTPARPPETRSTDDGTSYLAPIDPEGGGSWILVNEHGLAATLLNAYEHTAPVQSSGEKPRSRGQLLLALSNARSTDEFEAALRNELLKSLYDPCFLCAFDLGGRQLIRLWDGRELVSVVPRIPGFLTTSSVRPKEVVAHREEAFMQALGAPPYDWKAMETFHAGLERPADAFNVRMSRPDAKTVSQTHIRTTEGRQTLRYAPRDRDGAFVPWTSFHLEPVKQVANAPGNPTDPVGGSME
jgi:hypothetical protein